MFENFYNGPAVVRLSRSATYRLRLPIRLGSRHIFVIMEGSPYNPQPLGKENVESIKVLVRVRPLSQTELADNNDSVVDIIDNQSLKVTSSDGKKSFSCSYDSVLGPLSSQVEVYDVVRSCTQSVIDGFNSTIFAYGQTGSGKVRAPFTFYWVPTVLYPLLDVFL